MAKYKEQSGALTVVSGVNQPSAVNIEAVNKLKKKKQYSESEYVEGILSGNRIILSQAITLIESVLPEHHELAQRVIEKCLPHSGKSVRVGITGVPGVGKSSFIETLGSKLTALNHKVAVLAVDPSSERSKGSILGDKTRMEKLASDMNAFIRPSPSAGTLGGVARKTRESIILCEAAGFDVIFVETVGVGQSETAVRSMVDFFLLLMLAGAGDELQGIKRGIVEMADLIAITKADGSNKLRAGKAMHDFSNALQFFPPPESGWPPKVFVCSAHAETGIDEIGDAIFNYSDYTSHSGYFSANRQAQARFWMHQTIENNLKDSFYRDEAVIALIKQYEKEVVKNRVSPFEAAKIMLQEFQKRKQL
ncbi:MAG: methylmalonyl Co-A mutase-associated GTPase MeaB [Bacteroidales bacterium]|nr:methylmalonyl Co-A mutase-associated GTPase MeaB [Bacteroidales bacterium]